MLVEGLAGSIRTDGSKAIDAAHGLAQGTMDAFAALEEGLSVPLEVESALQVPTVDLDPTSIPANRADRSTGEAGGVDVAGIVDATARRILGSLDISVVLNDGTLVGKLAPAFDRQLARLDRRNSILAGGV
jgi:hypothetical protein